MSDEDQASQQAPPSYKECCGYGQAIPTALRTQPDTIKTINERWYGEYKELCGEGCQGKKLPQSIPVLVIQYALRVHPAQQYDNHGNHGKGRESQNGH